MLKDKYTIVSTAQLLLRMIRETDEKTRNEAYQILAHKANESEWAQHLEPLQGICLAFQAIERQLCFSVPIECEICTHKYSGCTPGDCLNTISEEEL